MKVSTKVVLTALLVLFQLGMMWLAIEQKVHPTRIAEYLLFAIPVMLFFSGLFWRLYDHFRLTLMHYQQENPPA